MANIDAKRTIRTFKDFSLGLSANGGGSVVVTELPETGDEHTIYELQETSKGSYNWVAMCTDQMEDDGVDTPSEVNGLLIVFDTYNQMTNVFNNIIFTGPVLILNILVYLKNEDKLYTATYGKGEWGFYEIEKQSNYIFGPFMEDAPLTYVLKSYEGYDEEDKKYYGTLYDDTKVELNDGHKGFLLHQVSISSMSLFILEMDLQEVLEGPTVYTEIPYGDIILKPHNFQYWIFKPEQGGEIVSSYWIYTDGEWVNIDEIPDPNLIKIGVTCSNCNWDVRTLPLDTITVTYDDVDYNVTQYAETSVPTEQGAAVTYYGYIEVPMPTQDNLTHTFKVSTTGSPTNWSYSISVNDSDSLNSKYTLEGNGILVISIYYDNNA